MNNANRGRTPKLSDLQKRELIHKAQEGCPTAALSAEFNITRPSVNKILKENGIYRTVGSQSKTELYYNPVDPTITLHKDSHKYLLRELDLQNIRAAHTLAKKCNISIGVATAFLKHGRIQKSELERICKELHIYVSFKPKEENSVDKENGVSPEDNAENSLSETV